MVVRPTLDPDKTHSHNADSNFTAMRPNDVAQALDLDRIAKDHVWKVEPSCATSGEGKNHIRQHKNLTTKETHADTLRQAFSKVSPGSARTSRSRRSKREPNLHPTTHTRYHHHTQRTSSIVRLLYRRAILISLPRYHVQSTLHDRLRSHWIPRISRRRTKT